MKKILFVNACVRACSRTLVLAKDYLKNADGVVSEIKLEKENLKPLDQNLLAKRDELLAEKKLDDVMFLNAKAFAEADEIVIAAPFWDLGFPALLKIYLENIMVAGITFAYDNGIPKGLCKAEKLTYITTSGGPVFEDFGYSYVKSLAKNFFNIQEVFCRRAENLDVECIKDTELLEKAKITDIK
ncbi:MAG: NAD(P)H-dependent oxidoreductase [Clostridia bacterium]|nr:NAD(P)H-dependent oxidoreductase [Clostridia bacterium]